DAHVPRRVSRRQSIDAADTRRGRQGDPPALPAEFHRVRQALRLSRPQAEVVSASGLADGLSRRSVLALRAAFVGVVFLAQHKADRRTGKIEGLAQRVQQIPFISIGHGVGTSAKNYKAGRTTLGLRDVVEPQ